MYTSGYLTWVGASLFAIFALGLSQQDCAGNVAPNTATPVSLSENAVTAEAGANASKWLLVTLGVLAVTLGIGVHTVFAVGYTSLPLTFYAGLLLLGLAFMVTSVALVARVVSSCIAPAVVVAK